MTLDTWLKFGHILGAMVWLGGGVVLTMFGVRARRGGDPAAIAEFGRTLGYVGPRIMIPSVLAVLVFGIWLVLENAAWDFGQLWVVIAIGLFAIAFLIGAVVLGRIGIQLQRLGDRSGGDADAGQLLNRWILGYGAVLVVLVIAAWDMVFKPGM
jgi:uncharacterized membrane protein